MRKKPHHFHVKEVDAITEAFSHDGFFVLEGALTSELLIKWQAFGQKHFNACFQTLHVRGHTRAPTHQNEQGKYVMQLGAKHGFREIVMRSPGRYELSLLDLLSQKQEELPDTSRILQVLEPILPKLLGDRSRSTMDGLKLCHLSLLVATQGSADQCWHADGGHVSQTDHLPCHSFNVFVPLQDIPLLMGPTEFRPGGHLLTRNLGPMILAAKCRKTLRAPVWPALALGDAVVFDYRVLHRGRANTTLTNRNVLVLTFCAPWFQDVLNFPKRSMMNMTQEEGTSDEKKRNSLSHKEVVLEGNKVCAVG
jgi:hypothetical protein